MTETGVHPRLQANNFDLLRLLFAGAVCLAHCYVLSGAPELRVVAEIFSSTTAVQAFFVVSGFLIFMSLERSTSLKAYFSKRVRRIYPAYFTVIVLCATLLAVVSSKPASEYFSAAWLRYVLANLAFLNFLQPTLPGVFENNLERAVNGALWTLKIEVMFYLCAPLIALLFRRLGVWQVLLALYFGSVVYAHVMSQLGGSRAPLYAELGRQLPGQLSYFMAGAFFYYYLPLFERHVAVFVAAALALMALDQVLPLPVFAPWSLATLVAFFGLFMHMGNFARYGDFSYGVYILHFPIIQLLVMGGGFATQPWLLVLCAVSLTFGGAALMWHIVEKRFLSRRNHYVTGRPVPPSTAAG